MDKVLLKKQVCDAIDANREKICQIGRAIYVHPELGYKELFASDMVKKTFDELGLKYDEKLGITGVKAKLKDKAEGPNVAIMGELDAVVCPEHPDADKTTGAAHCCGHFGQITTMLASAFGLSAIKDSLDGNVTFLAVPAEECVELAYREGLIKEGKIKYLGGKQELIHLGVYDDIDMAFLVHGNNAVGTVTASSRSVGFIAKNVKFVGKEAHAGGSPWNGVNALNAASLALMAINSIRETLKDQDCIRIHPIITKGGTLVNIVPDDVRMEMYVRGASIEAIKDANFKVNRAIKGAAYAIGAEVVISDMPGYLPVDMNQDLCHVFGDNAKIVLPKHEVMYFTEMEGGSSDVGDVATIMPCVQGGMGGFENGFHTKNFRLVDEEMAFINPAKVMACSVVDLLADGALKAKEIKANFKSQYNSKNYDQIWDEILKFEQ
ncbi:MAG: amidohydrolase [Oscillospiraceae bacterium]